MFAVATTGAVPGTLTDDLLDILAALLPAPLPADAVAAWRRRARPFVSRYAGAVTVAASAGERAACLCRLGRAADEVLDMGCERAWAVLGQARRDIESRGVAVDTEVANHE